MKGRGIIEELSHVDCEQHGEQPDSSMTSFTPMSESKLLGIVKSLSPSQSSGIEDLPTDLVFCAIEAKPDIFVRICNVSLMKRVFPKQCKLARVRVIPKKVILKYVITYGQYLFFLYWGKFLRSTALYAGHYQFVF